MRKLLMRTMVAGAVFGATATSGWFAHAEARSDDPSRTVAGISLGARLDDVNAKCRAAGWTCETKTIPFRRMMFTKVVADLRKQPRADHHYVEFVAKDGVIFAIRQVFRQPDAKRHDALSNAAAARRKDRRGRSTWLSTRQGTWSRLSKRGDSLTLVSLEHAAKLGLTKPDAPARVKQRLTASAAPRPAGAPSARELLPPRPPTPGAAQAVAPAATGSCVLTLAKPPLPLTLIDTESKNIEVAVQASCASTHRLKLSIPTVADPSTQKKPWIVGVSAPFVVTPGASAIVSVPVQVYVPGVYKAVFTSENVGVVPSAAALLGTVGITVQPRALAYAGPNLAITALEAPPTVPTNGSYTVKATVKNVGFMECNTGACDMKAGFNVRYMAYNDQGFPTFELKVPSATRLRWKDTATVQATLLAKPTGNNVSGESLRLVAEVMPEEHKAQDMKVNRKERPLTLGPLEAKPAAQTSLQVAVALDRIQCIHENDPTSWFHGDDPRLYVSEFNASPEDNEPTQEFSWSEVESDKDSAVQRIDAKLYKGASVPATYPSVTGFHLSLWEHDVLDPDDEIDFAYVPLSEASLAALVDKGWTDRSIDLGGRGDDIADDGQYRVYYKLKVTKRVESAPAALALNFNRWAGSYRWNLGAEEGTATVSYNPPTDGDPSGLLATTWMKAGASAQTSFGGHLSGNTWQFHLGSRRFLGFLVGPPGEEAIAGTYWDTAFPSWTDPGRGFLMTRAPKTGKP